jgi:ATP-dependent DNA helicase RecQ
MRDQVQRALSLGIPAVAVTSQHSPSELAKVMAAMPRACLIYAAPERFDNATFHTMLSVNPPWLVAADESHSVGEAGLSFRPAYRFVRDLLDRRSTGFDTQWLAVTASATEEVVQDIRDTFRMQQARLIRLSCDRPNLSYRVQTCPTSEKFREVKRLLDLHLKDGGAAIVYTLKRTDAEELASYLQSRGRRALHYHAGMTKKGERQGVEEAFFSKSVDVVVATSAFGMGIDRSDVRLVCMAGMPKSPEDFYQMAGRAGRDGRPSVAVTLYDERRDYNFRKWLINSGKDLSENQYSQRYGFSDAKFEQAKARQLDLLAAVDRFLRSWNCRAVLLRRYFGEEPGQPCGNCDNCLQAKVARPVAPVAQKVLEPHGDIAEMMSNDFDEGDDEVPF